MDGYRDGRVILNFTVDRLNEIVYWVLAWSGRAKVVEPLALRNLLLTVLRDAVPLNGA